MIQLILPENQEIRNRVSIARGASIDCIDRLVNDYGRPNIQNWSKEKGRALIVTKGKLFEANLHFFSYEGKELYEP